MTKEAENNVDNSGEILASLDDSIEIIADEKGREIRKSADHPDKTRDIIFLDEDEENQENENSNNTSVLLDKVTKKTEVHETISVSPTTNTGTVKEYLTDLGLGILKDHQNGIILFHCDNLWMNGTKVASLPRPDIRRYDYDDHVFISFEKSLVGSQYMIFYTLITFSYCVFFLENFSLELGSTTWI